MASTCVRPGCGAPASATLTYDYGARIVWLDDLGGDRHPWAWGMCPAHADGLRVPEGWIREDRRRGSSPAEGPAHVVSPAEAVRPDQAGPPDQPWAGPDHPGPPDQPWAPDQPDWPDQPWADPGEPARHAQPAFQAEPTEPGF